jgi:type VI secretion system secreted protein VgrG
MANIDFSIPSLHGASLSVRFFDIAEGLSTPFEAMVVAACRDPDLDFDAIVGKPARLVMDGGARGSRTWGGVVSFVDQVETEADGRTLYAFRLVPSLQRLALRSNHRVFLRLSSPAIARAILHEWGIEPAVRLDERRFPEHAYRAQYGESDLAFLGRTLEEAGISYFFENGEGSPLVLAGAPEHGEPRPGPIPLSSEPRHTSQSPYVAHARRGGEVRPGAVELRDFDFTRPLYQASSRASAPGPGGGQREQRIYAPGSSAEGDARAERTLRAIEEGRRTVAFSTNLVDLAPGVVFTTTAAPDTRLCVVSTSLEGRAEGAWTIGVVAAPCDAPIRPALKTPRPRIEGVESAVVVGPKDEEIHVDEHGRVRLRFPWDREGQRDADRTPWVRVAEGWAGAGWGMITVPRVGQEVLVAFLEGDPDQPVVVGRVHDASSPPPEVLPAARTRSVLRSRSSPGADGHHEIAFDDRRGHELVQVRSERDLETVALHDQQETAGLDRTATVGRHLSATMGGEDAVSAGELHAVSIGGGPTRREIAAKRITLTTGDATILLDGPDILVSGRSGVTIRAGGTVSIQGEPYVHINPPGAAGDGAAPAPQAPDHVVHFKLTSEGTPLAGARCHVEHEDGSASGPLVTDANGLVRVPVDKPGTYHVKLGHPRDAKASAASAAPTTDPATGGAAVPTIGVGQTPAQPPKKSAPTEHPVPISLEILHPRPNATFDLLTTPAMPKIPLQARVLVQGQEVATGTVRWELHASGDYRVRDEAGTGYVLQNYVLPVGHTRTTPGKEVHFELASPEIVGGDLEVKAVFDGGAALGGVSASKSVKGCRLLGKNAPVSEVEAAIAEQGGPLAWLYLRLFWWESGSLAQFAEGSGGGNTPGHPLYGPPSGVGIVQRDPTAGEWSWPRGRITRPNNFFPRIFWDWRKNLAEGISSFTATYIERGRADLDLLRREYPHLPPYPEGVLLRASIRRYNGGTEYGVSGDGRHYVVSPVSSNPGYVDDVLFDPHVDAHKYPIPAATLAHEWP